MSNLNLQKLCEWVWPWPWTFKCKFLNRNQRGTILIAISGCIAITVGLQNYWLCFLVTWRSGCF